MKMQLVEYETWGNVEEGFEVNNIYRTDAYYDIDDDATEADVIHKLKTVEQKWPGMFIDTPRISPWLQEGADVGVDVLDPEFMEIVITDTGEPIGRLEAVHES